MGFLSSPPGDFTTQLDPTVNAIRGSQFIQNGNSFTGVDIKVVVHIGDRDAICGGRVSKRIQELRKEIAGMDEAIREIEKQLLAAQNTSPASQNPRQITKLTETSQSNLTNMQALGEELKRLEKDLYGSFSYSTKTLAEVQTLSVSTHREKSPVRSIGAVYPKAFCRGPRTIAGSIVFTVFHQHVLQELLQADPSDFEAFNPSTALIDQLPPFDITIAFANEYGYTSRMSILGVEFVNEGQTMSIQDLLLENVTQYVARDIDPMRAVSKRNIDENNLMTSQEMPLMASSLLKEDDYQKYQKALNPYARYSARRNPWV
jgi:hypothetical protein